MKEWAKKFYASTAWHECRDGYISYRVSIDGGMCELCHEKPGYIVHHKKHLSPSNINDPNVSLNWGNLQYVCKECHDREHEYGGRYKPIRRVVFDRNGNPVVPPVSE